MNPAIILAIALSVAHYFSDVFSKFFKTFHKETISFSAGFFIAYIFLELFPKISPGIVYIDIFLLMLIGFSLFHIAEKYVYQHNKDKYKLLKDLKELHIIGFFIDHFIVGFLLILTLKLPGLESILVIIPLALHTISSSLSLESIDKESKTSFNKIILSASTTIGAIAALFISVFTTLYYSLFALSIGALLYIVIRDILPQKDGGSQAYFIIGVLLNILLVILARSI
jgi:zinc transporter ZupT